MLNKLRSCYNKCIKILFGIGQSDSLTNILVNLGLPSFDALMANSTVSYARLCTSCTNRMVMRLYPPEIQLGELGEQCKNTVKRNQLLLTNHNSSFQSRARHFPA